MNTSTAQRLSFPTTLFNHPTSRYLLVTGIHLIMRHIWIEGCKFLIPVLRHDRIHKETTRITCFLRIRKFGLADFNDGVAQLLGRWFLDSLSRQFNTDISIVEMGTEGLRQTVCHSRYQEAVLPVFLESALPITVFEFLITPDMGLARSNLDHPHTQYQVLGLNTISTDILNGRSADITRDQREVFHTIVTSLNTGGYHIVPRLTTTTSHPYTTKVIFLKLIALDTRTHDNTIKIFCQQQITATTYYNKGHLRLPQDLSHIQSFKVVFKLQITTTLDINTKCVMRLQTIIPKILHLFILLPFYFFTFST